MKKSVIIFEGKKPVLEIEFASNSVTPSNVLDDTLVDQGPPLSVFGLVEHQAGSVAFLTMDFPLLKDDIMISG